MGEWELGWGWQWRKTEKRKLGEEPSFFTNRITRVEVLEYYGK